LRFLREPNSFFSRKGRKGLRKGREKDQPGLEDQKTRRRGDRVEDPRRSRDEQLTG